MLFVWGRVEGQRARVLFSSVELGSTLTGNKACVVGQSAGKVWAGGKERETIRLKNGSVEGKALGSMEVALVEAWEASTASPAKLQRLRDGFVLEEDDTQCLLVVGALHMGVLQLVFERGRLRFEGAEFVAEGKRIRFEEHLHLGIPFGQFMAVMNGKKIPLRLVLETSRWPSYLHETFSSGPSMAQDKLPWEALWLSLEAVLPEGSFELQAAAALQRYWPWAEGSVGMKAFECCRLVWSPRQGVATVQWLPQAHGKGCGREGEGEGAEG